MLPQKKINDIRQYCRFKVPDGAYVVFNTAHGQGMGFLSDLSSGGLSFEYIPTEETSAGSGRIDLVVNAGKVHIDMPSCHKIFELELEDKYYTPVKLRRVGVRFNGIDPRKLNELASLICPEQNLI